MNYVLLDFVTNKFKMNRIKAVLDEKGLTVKLGKSYNMVNSYAQNRRQPSIEILFRIASIFNIEAKELLVESLKGKNKI